VSASSVELCSDTETASCSPLPLVDWMEISPGVCGSAVSWDVVNGTVGLTDMACEGENIS